MKNMVLLCVLLVLPATSQSQSAADMQSNCRDVISSLTTEETIQMPQDYRSGICWGFFAAIQKAMVIANESSERALGVCAPAESKRSQLIKVFDNYVSEHPERLHEEAFWVALNAYSEVWGCE